MDSFSFIVINQFALLQIILFKFMVKSDLYQFKHLFLWICMNFAYMEMNE